MQTVSRATGLPWVDAALLQALTWYRWRWSRPMTLWRLVDVVDILFREEPSFDDISFSLPRLLAAGLVEVKRNNAGEVTLKATRAAFGVKADAGRAGTSLAEALGALPYESEDPGDRSRGRYPDLSSEDWSAVRKHLDYA